MHEGSKRGNSLYLYWFRLVYSCPRFDLTDSWPTVALCVDLRIFRNSSSNLYANVVNDKPVDLSIFRIDSKELILSCNPYVRLQISTAVFCLIF